MKIPFKSPGRRRLVAILSIALAGLYVGLAATLFAAAWLGSRVELTSLKSASWLDPGNAEYRNLLGRYFDLVKRDPKSAIGPYQAAVQLNPHSARFWFDLASAYQVNGDTANQSAALEHAIQADSMTPDVAWEAANLYLVQGENDKALREFRVVLANDSSLADLAIQYCWRIAPDEDRLLRDVVPPNGSAYIAFLALLQNEVTRLLHDAATATADPDPASQAQARSALEKASKETAATFKVWAALIDSHQPFEQRYATDYIRFLISHKQVDQAVLVWQQSASRFGLSSYLATPANLIVNPRFTLPVLNAGFDWQYQKQSGVKLRFDPNDYHIVPGDSRIGRQSMTITFDGPGINDAGIYQFVAVQPGATYDFSAYYKNTEQEGAGGPRFTVQDMYTQKIYFESDDLNDAGFWKAVNGEFTTGPDCKLVVLHVRRVPEGHPLRGKLWIDDFHLAVKPT
jgi:tetratricopeptide (TPR) repeat protein